MRYLLFLLLFNVSVSFGQPVSEEAQTHYDRGQAAMELAQTQADYTAAIAEYTEAARLAPNWPDVYLALGQVQEKIEQYTDAIVSYSKYVELAPTAPNAGTIKSLINKLKYKLEKIGEKEKIMTLLSSWDSSKDYTDGCKVCRKKTGGNGYGVYHLKKFIKVDGKLQAYIYSGMYEVISHNNWGVPYEQTVPVEFDGRIMKFNYDYYHCPTLSQFQYCQFEVKITAEVISVSPLKFNVKEEWKDLKENETKSYDAVWEFTDATAKTIQPVKPVEEIVQPTSVVNNVKNATFVLTLKTYSEKDDLENAVKQEMGDTYRIADWNDVVEYCKTYSVAEFLKMVDLENGDTQDPMVTFNNKHFWEGWDGKGSNRHYFISRFDDQLPRTKDNGTYLAHQNIDGNKLTLASWSNLNAHILCVKKSNK